MLLEAGVPWDKHPSMTRHDANLILGHPRDARGGLILQYAGGEGPPDPEAQARAVLLRRKVPPHLIDAAAREMVEGQRAREAARRQKRKGKG